MSSRSYCGIALAKALKVGEETVNLRDGWHGGSLEQTEFLKKYNYLQEMLGLFSEEELISCVAEDADTINQFLKEHGFDIKLEPFDPPTRFSKSVGIAGILSVLFEWKKKGFEHEIYASHIIQSQENNPRIKRHAYNGALIDTHTSYFISPNHNYPIACLTTKNDDRIYMTIAPDVFDLESHISFSHDTIDILDRSLKSGFQYDGCIFPCINFNYKPDINFLCGVNGTAQCFTDDDLAIIIQAIQQDKFKMDYIGGKIESAAAIEIFISGCLGPSKSPIYMTINEPFLLWAKRNNQTYFKAYFDFDSWIRSKYDQ